MTAHAWQITDPATGVTLRAEPADAAAHAELLHTWMNEPHVVPWWQLDRPLPDIRAYLAGLTHLQPWIVSADGRAFGYVETYRVADDPLASYYPVHDGDVGWHLLVGPPDVLGTGLPRALGRVFVDYLLGLGQRVVCEPDIRNTRMHAYCRRLGFHSMGEVDLPDKRALLMVCDRVSVEHVREVAR